MMDKKVVKFVVIGFGLYAVFAALVLTFYEDDTDNMGWEDRQAFNKRYISALSLDENIERSNVIQTLGSPDLTEAKRKDDTSFQVMFYRTQHLQSDGITTKDECTPMLFKNGYLIAWGDSAYQQFNNI
ncbi:DUF3192 domain-containing protein [Psychrosphaera saromensis]|nr:DUF3192 domain-containing protein [Psychrosphaera saromensis]GLQ12676.1 DUF3192 domain-containing protein [Psychrosphaera saromensis]